MVGPEHKVEQREIIDLETSIPQRRGRVQFVREKEQGVPGQ